MEVQQGIESQSGTSPIQKPLRTWAGHGTGVPCNACGRAIDEKDIEYEVEMLQAAGRQTLHFHFNCYQSWVAAQRSERA